MRDVARIDASWLLRLRWGAVLGQLAVIASARYLLFVPLPLAWLVALVGLEAGTNALLAVGIRKGRTLSERTVLAVMGFDILVLTGLLYLSGGTFNPFSFLYLVHIALAAIVLRPVWTWSLVALALASFGALFLFPAQRANHLEQMHLHVRGMWVAFAIAAAFIVYFVQRVTRALADREAELQRERARRERDARVTGFATLAAGAAHELSTPLATIAVVARELERSAAGEPARADAALIRGEVERCRAILAQLAFDSGVSHGEAPERIAIAALVDEALQGLVERDRVQVSWAENTVVEVPRRPMAQALRGVIKNALQAGGGVVRVHALRDADTVRVTVRDDGAGMAHEVLERLGEPFFTTKAAGEGMGLGIFLTRAILEQLGGSIGFESKPGCGTTAVLTLPAAAAIRRTGTAVCVRQDGGRDDHADLALARR
ncbi:MAG: HAMP domain-containing histidine kinase [Myxococcaceae bacterium]|nr:HAMP domain-containing histidine kinase [Myxococcaceae bacterium]